MTKLPKINSLSPLSANRDGYLPQPDVVRVHQEGTLPPGRPDARAVHQNEGGPLEEEEGITRWLYENLHFFANNFYEIISN